VLAPTCRGALAALLVLGGIATPGPGRAQAPAGDALLPLLRAELDRNFGALKKAADPAPYFISYLVVEEQSEALSASLGP
jgi:hypothetical protein